MQSARRLVVSSVRAAARQANQSNPVTFRHAASNNRNLRQISAIRSYTNSRYLWGEEKADSTAQKPEEEKSEAPNTEKATEEPKEVSEVEVLQGKVTELESRNKDLQDRVLRALAEMENVRKIAARDVKNEREFAIQKFAKSLLDVADNLERAIQHVPESAVSEADGSHFEALLTGVKMTDEQLQKTLRSFGVVKVGAVGEKFDPQLHEAMFEYADPEKEAGSIGQLIKVGYTLNARLLRPAQVGTIKSQ